MPSDPYRDSQALPRQTPCRTAWVPGRLPQASTPRTKAQIGRSSSGPSRQKDDDLPIS
jgi:hypothetical protein